MGKGQGDKTGFERFLDESYFSFVFFNWFLGLFIVGAALIIIGAVVGSVLPGKQAAAFGASQALTNNANSYVYTNWQAYNEKDNYTFMNVASVDSNANPVCSNYGPYVYANAVSRVSLSFSADGSTVSYQLSKTKTFDPADSGANLASQATVTSINPPYAKLVKALGEPAILTTLYNDLGIGSNLTTLFNNVVPALIAGEGIRNQVKTDYANLKSTIYSDFFGANLQTSLNNYGLAFLNYQLDSGVFVYTVPGVTSPTPSTSVSSFKTNVNNRLAEPTCGAGSNTVEYELLNGFPDVQNGACKSFLYNVSFVNNNVSLTQADVTTIWANLTTLSAGNNFQPLQLWYSYEYPTTEGYCLDANLNNPNFNPLNLDNPSPNLKMKWVCKTYLPIWYQLIIEQDVVPVVGASATIADIAPYHFCVGGITSNNDPYLIPFNFPPVVPLLAFSEFLFAPAGYILSAYLPSSQTFQIRYQTTYNATSCKAFISYFTNTTNLVAASNATSANIPGGATLAQVQAYLSAFTSFNQGYYVYRLLNNYNSWTFTFLPPAMTPGLSSSDITALTTQSAPGGGPVFAAIALFMYPGFPTSTVKGYNATSKLATLGLTIQNSVSATNIYDPVTTVSGVAALILGVNSPGDYSLSASQYGSLRNWIQYNMNNWATNEAGISYANLGFQQFISGNLLPGCKNVPSVTPVPSCSISNYFYGLNQNYYPEYALAAFLGPFYGPNSVLQSDDTIIQAGSYSIASAQSLINSLPNPTSLLAQTGPGTTGFPSRYINYLFNAYVIGAFPGSGLYATRPYSDFILGYTDPIVSLFPSSGVSAYYAIDPNVALDPTTYTIKTGTAVTSSAYTFSQINGSATLTGYYSQPLTISGLYNPDQFAPGLLQSPSASSPTNITVWDVDLKRPLTYSFNGTTQTVNSLTGLVGLVDISQWTQNTSYNMPTDYALPVAGASSSVQEYYGPCSASIANAQCFPTGYATPAQNTIIIEAQTGQTLNYVQCYVRYSTAYQGSFTITQSKLQAPADLYQAQLVRITNRTISAQASTAIDAAETNATASGHIILIVLVVIGAIFCFASFFFLTFYILKKRRASEQSALSELVNDPFKEKNDRFGNTGF